MTYVKINDALYPASISGKIADKDWDNRASKAITLEMSYAEAIKLFTDGAVWSIVEQDEVPVYETDENGEVIIGDDGNAIQTGVETRENEWDNSEYNLAGDLTDHRDGTITAKMGKLTDLEEAYEIMLGGAE